MKVIWCVVDCLRQDGLSANGYRRPTTTAIDQRLSTDFVSFDDCCTQSAFTLSVISSLITGTYPSTHGALRFDGQLTEDTLSLADMDVDNLGDFHVIPGMDFVTGGWGLERCFDEIHDLREEKDNRDCSQARAGEIRSTAEEAIIGNSDLTALLWFFDLHKPWLGERSFMGPNEARDSYDSELHYVAQELDKLFSYLEERDEYGDAMIILTGDHGDIFREYGRLDGTNIPDGVSSLPLVSKMTTKDYLGHLGKPLLDELLHVPLYIKFPGQEYGGDVVRDQVELIDILPTIIDYADGTILDSIEGESLLPALQTGDGKDFVFAEMEANPCDGKFRCIRSPEYKLIQHTPPSTIDFSRPLTSIIRKWLTKRERFLARVSERHDLDGDAPAKERLQEELKRWINRPSVNDESDLQSLSSEQEDQLESLGYI